MPRAFTLLVLRAHTTCATDYAAWAISECLGPLLDHGSPGRHELCHLCRSVCSLQTPRAFTRPVYSWRALPVPPMTQLVQSLKFLSLYSTCMLLARTAYTANTAACAVYEHRGSLLDPCTPDAHNSYVSGAHYLCADDSGSAVSARP